jgi:hypothetical protein
MGTDEPFHPSGPFEKKFELDAENRILGLFGQGKKQNLQPGGPEIGIQKQGFFQPGLGLFTVPGLDVQKRSVIIEQKIVRVGFDTCKGTGAGFGMDMRFLILRGMLETVLNEPLQEHETKLFGDVFQP